MKRCSTAPRSPAEAEIEATAMVLDAETQWLRESSEHWNIAFRTQILRIVDEMKVAITTGDFINAVPKAAQLIELPGRLPCSGPWPSSMTGWRTATRSWC